MEIVIEEKDCYVRLIGLRENDKGIVQYRFTL